MVDMPEIPKPAINRPAKIVVESIGDANVSSNDARVQVEKTRADEPMTKEK